MMQSMAPKRAYATITHAGQLLDVVATVERAWSIGQSSKADFFITPVELRVDEATWRLMILLDMWPAAIESIPSEPNESEML